MNGDAPRFLVSFSAFSSRFVSFLPSFFFFFAASSGPTGRVSGMAPRRRRGTDRSAPRPSANNENQGRPERRGA